MRLLFTRSAAIDAALQLLLAVVLALLAGG